LDIQVSENSLLPKRSGWKPGAAGALIDDPFSGGQFIEKNTEEKEKNETN
jgi:hypothetical protein